MGAEPTILHIADSHLGAALPTHPRSTRPRRGDDFIASYRRVLRRALEQDADLVIHGGDLYDLPSPSAAAVTVAAAALLEVANAGIPIVIVPGNHERSAIPGSVLFAHPNIHILGEPRTCCFSLRGTRVAVAGFPCIRRGSQARFAEALAQTGWETARADVTILAVHQTFESAVCGPVNFRFRAGEDVVARDAVPTGLDYVACGHVHRYQALTSESARPVPIVYAGSHDRISFAEIDEPKGAVLLRFDRRAARVEFLEHPVRPMCSLPMDVTGLSQADIRAQAAAWVAALPADGIGLLRLSGQIERHHLRGLRLTESLRTLRPDALIEVSAQAIQTAPSRVGREPRDGGSAFEALDPPARQVWIGRADEAGALPTGCGTYALYDRAGRLLYVGKARTIRPRLRTHLRGADKGGFFRGWAAQITRMEVRPAASELEALLVEADLIAKLRPPFNRQMRAWERYAYVGDLGLPHRQLEVCRDPPARGFCFGPFASPSTAERVIESLAMLFGAARCPDENRGPSRATSAVDAAALCERYFAGACAGPCALRILPDEYARRIERRTKLLSGEDDGLVAELAAGVEALADAPEDDPRRKAALEWHETAAAILTRGQLLRAAQALYGALLLLPGADRRAWVACCHAGGLLLDALTPNHDHAGHVLRQFSRRTANDEPTNASGVWLPKAVADVLCTAARSLRPEGTAAIVIPRAAAQRLQPDELLAAAAPLLGDGLPDREGSLL